MIVRGRGRSKLLLVAVLPFLACAGSRRGALPADGAIGADLSPRDHGASHDADDPPLDGPSASDVTSGRADAGVAEVGDVVAAPDVPSLVDAPAVDTSGESFAPCPLTVSGAPVFVDFAVGAISRGVALLDAGDPDASPPRPVHLALHAMVDRPADAEIHAADLHLQTGWPAAVSLDHPELLVGPAAHSASMAHASPDGKTLLLTYYGHPITSESALQLLPIDVATWVAGPFATVTTGQWAVPRGLARGAGLEPRAAFAGDGFGLFWTVISPTAQADEPRGAVMRANGSISSGPWSLRVGPDSVKSAIGSVVWSGTTYLYAVIAPDALILARAPTGTEDATLQPTSTFPLENADTCCVVLGAYGGTVWAAWYERANGDAAATAWNIRLVRLAADGTARERPVTLAGGIRAAGLLGMTANRNGMLIAWMESMAPENFPGAYALQVRQFGPDGNAIGLPKTLELGARVRPVEGLSAVSIDNPSGVLLGWSDAPDSEVFMGRRTALLRLECRGS